MKKAGYLHGYSRKEQRRLYEQALFLEPYIYNTVNFKKNHKLLEVGCGVGAQTKLLLKHFPQLKIHGIDASPLQLAQAQKHLKKQIQSKKVSLSQEDAGHMNLKNESFDSAFLCWFLEHVSDPVKVLKETRDKLKKGSVIICNEVHNASFFVEPYSPSILKYWFHFNDQQWMMKGNPFVGVMLGNLLKKAGFKKIEIQFKPLFFDSRDVKKRRQFLNFWTRLMLSGAPALLKEKRITQKTLARLKKEIGIVKSAKDGVFLFTFVQARAVK